MWKINDKYFNPNFEPVLENNTISYVHSGRLKTLYDDVYNYYEFDCETGTLVEKEVDETDMPHISQRAFKKKIDDTIKFVYYTIMVIATLYVVFYIYVLIKNKRK